MFADPPCLAPQHLGTQYHNISTLLVSFQICLASPNNTASGGCCVCVVFRQGSRSHYLPVSEPVNFQTHMEAERARQKYNMIFQNKSGRSPILDTTTQ